MDGAFCVECGREGPTVDALCAECLRKRTTVAVAPPAGTYIEICRHCGATPQRQGWAPGGSVRSLVERAAIAATRVVDGLEDIVVRARPAQVDVDRYRVAVMVEGHRGGVPLEGSVDVPVKVRGASCPSCSRRHGGYYEAIVQVRGWDEALEAPTLAHLDEIVLGALAGAGGGHAGSLGYLLKREPMHGGMDYYFGTQSVARAVARAASGALGARITESKTIAGKRDGVDITRLTLSVRLPPAPPGSLVALGDAVYRVQAVQPHRVLAEHVESGARATFDERTVERLYRFKPDEVRLLDIVFAQGDEAQALDPDTLKTETLRALGLTTGSRVPAVKWADRWWVVGKG